MSEKVIPYHRPYSLDGQSLGNILSDINGVLKSGQLTNGKYCRELESYVSQYYNATYAITTNNCTQGLLLCLLALDNRPKEVHTAAFGWYSSKWVIETIGAKPIWHDIDKHTWLMEYFKPNGDVIMPVHTFGNTFPYANFGDDCTIIYDGAHALFSDLNDIGDATVFSLAPTKLITSCEGGIIITNNEDMGRKLIELRDKTSRMSELNALVGLATLDHLDEILGWKGMVKEYYEDNIPGDFQEIAYDHNWNTIAFLNTENLKIPDYIQTKQYYKPLAKGLPNIDSIYDNIIALPSWFGVDYEKIVEDVLKCSNL